MTDPSAMTRQDEVADEVETVQISRRGLLTYAVSAPVLTIAAGSAARVEPANARAETR